MKYTVKLQPYSFPLGIIAVAALIIASQAFVCPRNQDNIFPCTCNVTLKYVNCQSPLLTQDNLDYALRFLRFENELGADDWLNFTRLNVLDSKLEQLNLTRFMKISIDYLSISNNVHLRTIVGPDLSTNAGLLHVKSTVQLYNNSLTDEGLGETLRYFSPSLDTLMFNDNQLTGNGSSDSEFLPGLSLLTKLTELRLINNKIRKLKSSWFKANNKLGILWINGNQLNTIDENAFAMNLPVQGWLYLDLSDNNLANGDIHPRHGLATRRGTEVRLLNNKLVYLESSVWEAFIKFDSKNQLNVEGNPLFCDDRMKWLKDQKAVLENRVLNAFCTNDPGKTVFNTTLIR